MLDFLAQAEQKGQFSDHEQRPDHQPHDVIDEGRLASFVVMTDELDDPADHEQTNACRQPQGSGSDRQAGTGPQAQPQQYGHEQAEPGIQTQIEHGRSQRRQRGRCQPQAGEMETWPRQQHGDG